MSDIKWNKNIIINILENFSVANGYKLVEITKNLDTSILPSMNKDLALWMDTINGHPGGWYHRVKHGHDVASNIGEVYSKFGFKGVASYPYEILKDFTTPHGIPAPGTQVLVKSGHIGAKAATEWLSINIAEALTGGVALYSTYKLYKKKENGQIDKNAFIWASIGIGVKIVSGVATTNPILILSGVTDTAILITDIESAKETFKDFFDWDLIINLSSAAAVASAVGAGSAFGAMGVMGAIGTASTGTAISTLSGAAATNATLAAFGGGSLAAGGFGITGGVIVLSSGGFALAAAGGYLAYKYIKKKKKVA